MENKQKFVFNQEALLCAITQFKSNIVAHYKSQLVVDASVYCLCAFLDEIIMMRQSPELNKFKSVNLTKNFYPNSFGGEKFFIYLKKMLDKPQGSKVFIEFIYLLLCLGYKGKYFDHPEKLNDIKCHLFTIINNKFKTKQTARNSKTIKIKNFVTIYIMGFITTVFVLNLLFIMVNR
jgi:type IV/VI secretion system ImpK/VasF family protein